MKLHLFEHTAKVPVKAINFDKRDKISMHHTTDDLVTYLYLYNIKSF